MRSVHDILINRNIGEVPVSYPTSEAIKSLDDNSRYDSLWINVRSLYRNILRSVEDRNERKFLISPDNHIETGKVISKILSQEKNIIEHYLNGRISSVRLYLLGYQDLPVKFPHANLWEPKTEDQKNYHGLMDAVIDNVMGNDYDQEIEWDKGSELLGHRAKSIIITHYPVDLLSRTKFKDLRLLESHTGAIKSKSQWYTKLTSGKRLSCIPFNAFTLQLFGDGPVQFLASRTKYRTEVIKLAHHYKWTPITSMDRIRFSVDTLNDSALKEGLKKLM